MVTLARLLRLQALDVLGQRRVAAGVQLLERGVAIVGHQVGPHCPGVLEGGCDAPSVSLTATGHRGVGPGQAWAEPGGKGQVPVLTRTGTALKTAAWAAPPAGVHSGCDSAVGRTGRELQGPAAPSAPTQHSHPHTLPAPLRLHAAPATFLTVPHLSCVARSPSPARSPPLAAATPGMQHALALGGAIARPATANFAGEARWGVWQARLWCEAPLPPLIEAPPPLQAAAWRPGDASPPQLVRSRWEARCGALAQCATCGAVPLPTRNHSPSFPPRLCSSRTRRSPPAGGTCWLGARAAAGWRCRRRRRLAPHLPHTSQPLPAAQPPHTQCSRLHARKQHLTPTSATSLLSPQPVCGRGRADGKRARRQGRRCRRRRLLPHVLLPLPGVPGDGPREEGGWDAPGWLVGAGRWPLASRLTAARALSRRLHRPAGTAPPPAGRTPPLPATTQPPSHPSQPTKLFPLHPPPTGGPV